MLEGALVSPTFIPLEPSQESIIPVAIVHQSSLDMLLTGPTGTATTTIEITTPAMEELSIDPMDKDIMTTEEGHGTTANPDMTTSDDLATEEPLKNRLDTIKPGALDEDDLGVLLSNVTSFPTLSMTDMTMMGVKPDFAETSCSANVCRNGGTCLSTLTGPRCHCPLQFSGRQCEEEVTVDVPGFVGHSLLVHKLPDDTSGINIMLTFRTSTANGILFYTGEKDQMMIAAYLQDGILKFKVSCGLQIILFSDPRDRVDTGFMQSVRITLELETPSICRTVIQLNDTHTMKGEQEIMAMPEKPDLIYFGLMPHKRDPAIDIVHSGFQGCMNYLQVYYIRFIFSSEIFFSSDFGRLKITCFLNRAFIDQ
jgi:hypothetical protein